MRREDGVAVTVHQVKNAALWGFSIAKDKALTGRRLTPPALPPSNELRKEICGRPECCRSPCHFYLSALENKDLILWTDASFFPESRRGAAAFGWEDAGGLHVTVFRVRGPAARGEVIAIFAALNFVEQNFPARNISIFSDWRLS